MTIGDGIAYGTAWICMAASWIAWLRLRAPRHRHKWKETGRCELFHDTTTIKIGERAYCICEECGEQKSFDMD